MESISITIKETTNPKIIKFEAPVFFTKQRSYEYNNIDEAGNSPLAQQLFYLPFVKKIYISTNFIALERFEIIEWSDVQAEVAQQIEEYLQSGGVVVVEKDDAKKIPVTVYAESTPNPTVMKFVANKKLVTQPYEFASIDEAISSPLAKDLFHFAYVRSVFFDENFVSITKYEFADWNEITLEIREFIREFIESGKELIDRANYARTEKNESDKSVTAPIVEYDDISKQIISILDEYVKPAVASDGGNIMFDSYDAQSKTVKVILQGACSGCPSSTITLKNGIETMLKEMIGTQIEHVEAINA